jgi:cytochrome c
MEYFWTFAGTRQRCRVEVSPSKGFASQKGQMVFNMRLPCHSVGSGARNKVGQELNGLDGHHSGSVPGFDYSDANKNSGIVWNENTSRTHKGLIPGTKMIFSGVKNEQQVNDL